jgi:hypothetical protein
LAALGLAVLLAGFVSEDAPPAAGFRAVAAVARLPDLLAVCRDAITCSSWLKWLRLRGGVRCRRQCYGPLAGAAALLSKRRQGAPAQSPAAAANHSKLNAG